MSSLFGVELPTPVNFVIAFVFVLLLIGAAAWLVRRFGATRTETASRGRQPRLAVVTSPPSTAGASSSSSAATTSNTW